MEVYIAVLASLISVVNPLGAIPMYMGLTSDYTHRERRKSSFMIALYFFTILAAFFLGGTYILSFFGISINAMRIAGGLVIMTSGLALLNGRFEKSRAINDKVRKEAKEKEDIDFSPMAMPMLSGPGSISLLIGYYTEYPQWGDRFMILGVIATTALIVYLILSSSSLLFKFLGVAGLKAIARIMGFIVMSIGIQYIITGIVSLVNALL